MSPRKSRWHDACVALASLAEADDAPASDAVAPAPVPAPAPAPPPPPPPRPPIPAASAPPPSDEAVDVLARTIWGEARGEPVRGKEAVACVVLNRVARSLDRPGGYWWGGSVVEVCHKPWQFSCWNTGDPNRAKLLKVTPRDAAFAACLRIARRALAGRLPDPTAGATHYHARGVHPPWAWRLIPCAEIGRHLFYNDVE